MSIKTMMTELADAARRYLDSKRKLNTTDIMMAIQGGTDSFPQSYVTSDLINGTMSEIYIPYTVYTIRSKCFWGMGELTVYIPRTVKSIAEDAFLPSATLYCGFSQGSVQGAPWGAGQVIYDYEGV